MLGQARRPRRLAPFRPESKALQLYDAVDGSAGPRHAPRPGLSKVLRVHGPPLSERKAGSVTASPTSRSQNVASSAPMPQGCWPTLLTALLGRGESPARVKIKPD